MEDTRCCGSGTCIINAEGLCWCGQRWDGERMCAPEPLQTATVTPQAVHPASSPQPVPAAPSAAER